eukprot:1173957-Rhodomonas_salina.1
MAESTIFEPRSKWVMEPMQDPRAAAPSAPTWFRCSPSRLCAPRACQHALSNSKGGRTAVRRIAQRTWRS